MQSEEERPVKIGVAVGKSSSGEYALKWALENEITPSSTIYLIHVYPPLRCIPTPMGNSVPISEVNDLIVKKFQDEYAKEIEKVVDKYRRICHAKKVLPEVRKVEGDSIQQKLVDQIFTLGLNKLVLGTSTSTAISRAIRGETISKFVAKHTPHFCTIMVVHKQKLYSVKQATEALDSIPAAPASTDGGSFQQPEISSSEFDSARSSSSDVPSSSEYERTRSNYEMRSYASFQEQYIPSHLFEHSSHPISLVRAQTTPRLRSEAVLSDHENTHSHSATEMLSATRSRFEFMASPAEISPSRSSIEERSSHQFVTDPVMHTMAMSDSPSLGSSTRSSVHQDSFAHRILPNLEENGYGEEENDSSHQDSAAILLQNQLDEIKLTAIRAQTEADQQARAVNRVQQLVENATKMIAEKERERDEALRQAEMARYRSIEDARKLEDAVTELRIASREQERLQADMAEEVARRQEAQQALEESRCKIDEYEARIEEYKSSLESANRRAEEALSRLEAAREELEMECILRNEAEQRARKESLAKEAALATIRRLQRKYTLYSFEELEKATDNFNENNKLGQGGYGPVYKGELQHTMVAIKVLANDGERGRQEFEREVELLSSLHHPHMLILLGACPERACIVYEYMSNGSLEDRLLCKGGSPPLPWYVRFRICAEVAIALLFLHSRPEPIVHRDLKPGNILLDRNYVSKISDVGIAKLVPVSVTSSVTIYKETLLQGTMAYMDPEYLRTGVVSRESDVYALGIVMLQLLTGRQAFGVADLVEKAITDDNLYDILDKSAGEWPFEKAMELALLALECVEPRRRGRPKLESRILPTLEALRTCAAEAELAAIASASHSSELIVPNFLFCPISQEIMQNPHIAADGFTYDYEAINEWLKDHDTSPMTNLRLEHKNLIPNYAVRSAIQDWREKME